MIRIPNDDQDERENFKQLAAHVIGRCTDQCPYCEMEEESDDHFDSEGSCRRRYF